MSWEEVRAAFEWDGSLRDLYVLDTTRDDWQRLLDFLRVSGYPLRCWRGDEGLPIPDVASGLFWGETEWSPSLSADVGGVQIVTHFFSTDEIELDLHPAEVKTAEQAEGVFDFMRRVGKAVGKPIRLTPEGGSHLALFEYDPVTDTLRKGRDYVGHD